MSPTSQLSTILAVFQILSPLALCQQAAPAICYNPDGSTANDNIPCQNSTNGFTACCGPGALCMTNGYCLDQMIVARGACTDKSWESSSCALQCKNVAINTGKGLAPCSSGTWSCNYDSCSENFSLPLGNIILHNYQAAPLGISSQVTIDAAVPTTASVTATSASATPTTHCITPAQQQGAIKSANSRNEKKLAAVGAGVGVPLAIAAIAFLALFGLERRRNKRSSIGREPSLGHPVEQQAYGGWTGDQKVTRPSRKWNGTYEAPSDPRAELTGMENMTHEMPQSPR